MTVDQQIQVWNAVGTCSLALRRWPPQSFTLAGHTPKRVKLRVYAGVSQVVQGNGIPPREFACINATNLGELPVTIASVGWRAGKGNNVRHRLRGSATLESREHRPKLRALGHVRRPEQSRESCPCRR